jgi:uncharacterized protein (DUF697 family)
MEKATEPIEKAAETTEDMIKEMSKETVDKIIRRHVYASTAVGFIPLPLVDIAGLTGVQLNMLRKIAKEYGVPFSEGTVKNILLSLFGGVFPPTHAFILASVIKIVPGVGQAAGVTAMPILAGATTYAVGKLFAAHFAWGGDFTDFDSEKVKENYAKWFEEGKKVAAEVRSE